MQLRNLLQQKPPGYVWASVLCSLGGFLFGIDTGIIGPVTVMEDFTRYVGNPTPTVHGLIVSSILIPAAVSSFFAGRVADALGRPRGIAIGAFVFGVGAALEGASMHIAMFIVGRIIEGVGEGLYLGMLMVYICEISPPRDRGAFSMGPQLLTTLGLVTGFFTCYGTANVGSSLSWRLPFILLAAYSLAYSTAVLVWLPPSPRWLTLHGKTKEASDAWERLGVPAADREKILEQYDATVVEPAIPDARGDNSTAHTSSVTVATPKSKKAEFLDVFSSDARPRLFLAVFLMGMQQLSGIDGVLYYAPLLFQQAGLSTTESTFLASGVSAILIFAVTIPATLCADRWGRRTQTIFGGLGMTATMFLMGGLYAGGAVSAGAGAGRWVVVVCIYAFAVLYCVSWAVGIKVYAAEIQPQRTRASATSLAHGGNWATNFLVALVTPTLLARSSYGAYFLFGGCTLLTALVCWFCMPETRGLSLGEIEQAFRRDGGRGHGRGVSGLRKWAKALQRKVAGSRMSAAVDA
ncbi:hypothetical protein Hte_008361 [Hypoxylon texense]